MISQEVKQRSYQIRSGGLTPANLSRSLQGARARARGRVLLMVAFRKDRHLPRLDYMYWGKDEKGLELYFTQLTSSHLCGIAFTPKMQECHVGIRIGALKFCQISYEERSR